MPTPLPDPALASTLAVAPGLIAAAFAVGMALALALFIAWTTYNQVVVLRQRIEKARGNIDVALAQRHATLPNLVAAVRGYMAHEADVLEAVTRAREAWVRTAPIHEQAAVSDATSGAIHELFWRMERYPELKAAERVKDLQSEISRLEEMIADRRELYNESVYRYNTRIAQVPGAIFTPIFGWQPAELFTAEPAEHDLPSLELNPRA